LTITALPSQTKPLFECFQLKGLVNASTGHSEDMRQILGTELVDCAQN
jgi:hypothetical protein